MADRDSRAPITLEFQPLGRRVRVQAGANLLVAAHEAGVSVASVCGGVGLCDSCRVRIVHGDVSAASTHERDGLTADDLAAGYRLACQVTATSDLVVDVPVESIGAGQRLQLEWSPQIGEGAAGARLNASWNAAAKAATGPLGLAVDVGTTKIAAYLADLQSGRTLAAEGAMNPQVAHGEDVISRIAYADNTEGGAETLHRLVVQALNDLAADLCRRVNTSPAAISDAVVVGNTVMHHLACGLPVAQLGRAPYAPVVTEALTLDARDVGLQLSADAHVYFPPNLAGYVGADHVAVLAAAGPPAPGCRRLVIDIGTNTEISLLTSDRIVSCSCASGPAFEGAHISCGMRAATGAIERVRVVGNEVRCQTIGDAPPLGICGSGVLDAVAELVAHGALDRHGSFRRDHPLVDRRADSRVVVLASCAAAGHNRELVLTRQDVAEIQLAKAAIRAGLDLLLLRLGVEAEAVDEVVLAGAFGSYIDPASARRVGMLPDLPAGRFRQVGNAAGAGARLMLLSASARRDAERLARRVEYVDLTSDPRFTEVFARALGFQECP